MLLGFTKSRASLSILIIIVCSLGADPNVKDTTGRTPLHAAIAADAQGVFQILLANKSTKKDARTNDGTTPLILAARLDIEGMLEELLHRDVDINGADNNGKTALHWAAAVNNVRAVSVLLARGANRDAQDVKDETPLFVAAREGSFHAAKLLLGHFANREATDHMDWTPRDVAKDRMHVDIVKLLDEYQGEAHLLNGYASANGAMLQPYMHHSGVGGAGGGVRRKKKAKQQQQSVHASRSLSPHARQPRSISPTLKHQVGRVLMTSSITWVVLPVQTHIVLIIMLWVWYL